ncbi:MAG: hypothetical protein KDJ38_05825 [Gammaproteobacteria bacterium]|nr:hypothetical protein [Gammaproteobacteria bacterium]
MTLSISEEELSSLIETLSPVPDVAGIESALKQRMPALDWQWVKTRSHWHRLGGVVDQDHRRICDNIQDWAVAVADGDVDELITRYADLNYFATRLAGKTHYFTAPCSDDPMDFMQLEVEELQEVVDRPLVEPDVFPDSLEEFLDPVDYSHVESVPIGEARFFFRRVSSISDLIRQAGRESNRQPNPNLIRFFSDWRQSSAGEALHLCRYWVMSISQYPDKDSENTLLLRPKSVYDGAVPAWPDSGSFNGAELAVYIHAYDRQVGYPFAWYFNLLGQKSANLHIIESVLKDQIGAYDYLPARDLKLLRRWEECPYAV